jgi:hypothetical protein
MVKDMLTACQLMAIIDLVELPELCTGGIRRKIFLVVEERRTGIQIRLPLEFEEMT